MVQTRRQAKAEAAAKQEALPILGHRSQISPRKHASSVGLLDLEKYPKFIVDLYHQVLDDIFPKLQDANYELAHGNVGEAYKKYTDFLKEPGLSEGYPIAFLNRSLCLILLGYPSLAATDAYRARLAAEMALNQESIKKQAENNHEEETDWDDFETTSGTFGDSNDDEKQEANFGNGYAELLSSDDSDSNHSSIKVTKIKLNFGTMSQRESDTSTLNNCKDEWDDRDHITVSQVLAAYVGGRQGPSMLPNSNAVDPLLQVELAKLCIGNSERNKIRLIGDRIDIIQDFVALTHDVLAKAHYRLAYALFKCGAGAMVSSKKVLTDVISQEWVTEGDKKQLNAMLDCVSQSIQTFASKTPASACAMTGKYVKNVKTKLASILDSESTVIAREVYPWDDEYRKKMEEKDDLRRYLCSGVKVGIEEMGHGQTTLKFQAMDNMEAGKTIAIDRSPFHVNTKGNGTDSLQGFQKMFCDTCASVCIISTWLKHPRDDDHDSAGSESTSSDEDEIYPQMRDQARYKAYIDHQKEKVKREREQLQLKKKLARLQESERHAPMQQNQSLKLPINMPQCLDNTQVLRQCNQNEGKYGCGAFWCGHNCFEASAHVHPYHCCSGLDDFVREGINKVHCKGTHHPEVRVLQGLTVVRVLGYLVRFATNHRDKIIRERQESRGGKLIKKQRRQECRPWAACSLESGAAPFRTIEEVETKCLHDTTNAPEWQNAAGCDLHSIALNPLEHFFPSLSTIRKPSGDFLPSSISEVTARAWDNFHEWNFFQHVELPLKALKELRTRNIDIGNRNLLFDIRMFDGWHLNTLAFKITNNMRPNPPPVARLNLFHGIHLSPFNVYKPAINANGITTAVQAVVPTGTKYPSLYKRELVNEESDLIAKEAAHRTAWTGSLWSLLALFKPGPEDAGQGKGNLVAVDCGGEMRIGLSRAVGRGETLLWDEQEIRKMPVGSDGLPRATFVDHDYVNPLTRQDDEVDHVEVSRSFYGLPSKLPQDDIEMEDASEKLDSLSPTLPEQGCSDTEQGSLDESF